MGWPAHRANRARPAPCLQHYPYSPAAPYAAGHALRPFGGLTMQPFQRVLVVGVFHDRRSAELAVNELRRLGFGDERIGVAARDGEPVASTAAEGSQWETGAA